MRKLVIIALVNFCFSNSYGQQEALYRHEVGLNVSSLLVYGSGGETEIPTFSLLYKRDRASYGWRFFVNLKRDFNSGYGREYNSFVVRKTDTSEYRTENLYRERAYQWLSYGYEHRFGKRVQVYIALDLSAGVRKGEIEQRNSYYEDLTYYYSWGTLTDSLHFRNSGYGGTTDAKFRYVGLEGHVGIRIPVTSRYYLTFQSGVDYFFNSGYYSYKNGEGQLRHDRFKFFGTHTDRVINSISLSYRYNSIGSAKSNQ